MNKIILLGGSGFIGTELIKNFQKMNLEFKALTHKNSLNSDVSTFRGNILDKKNLDAKIQSNNTVINLVGQSNGNLNDFINLNIFGALNLLNSCINKKNSRIILISSLNIYGENMKKSSLETDIPDPKTEYGLVKLATEKIYEYFADKYNLNITILRLANIYGPTKKNGLITNLISAIFSNSQITLYNEGNQLRDYLYIDDAIDGLIRTIKKPLSGFNIFNISSQKKYSLNQMVKIVEEMSGKKINVKFTKEIPDERCIWANNCKAKEILEFEPKTDIKNGVDNTIKHFHSA